MRHTHMNGIGLEKLDKPIIPGARNFGDRKLSEESRGNRRRGWHPASESPRHSVGDQRDKDLLPLTKPFLMEVWNAFPTINNLGGTDGDGNVGMSPESIWDSLLSHGKVVWGVLPTTPTSTAL